MTSMPVGTVTLLFTDIEGSTRLWEEHTDEMRTALSRHDEFLRNAVESSRHLMQCSAEDQPRTH